VRRGGDDGGDGGHQFLIRQLGVEGVSVREALIEQHAQGVEVGAHTSLEGHALLPHLTARVLHELGWQQMDDTGRHAQRQREGPWQTHVAEVDEEGPAILAADEQVLGLQVPVVHAALVQHAHGAHHLGEGVHQPGGGRVRPPAPMVPVLPLHQIVTKKG
jgi:hypothetical protein